VLGTSGSTLLVSAYTVNDGNSGNNYAVITNNASGTITPATLAINAVSDSKGYDGDTGSDETPLVVGTVYSPDSVTGLDQVFQSRNVMGTNGSTLVVSAYTVNDGNSGNNYSVATGTASGTIFPKGLTVSGVVASNKPFDGNTVATLNFTGASLVGVISPDVVTLVTAGATGTFASHLVGTHVVTIAGLTLGGTDSGNYSLTQPTTTASITAWKLTGYHSPVGIANSYPGMPSVVPGTIWNTVKGGQTVPLKFEIFTMPVGGVELTSLSEVTGFTLVALACTPGAEDPVELEYTTPGATSLNYDGSQYHLNWQTPKGANRCYRMTMTARDGSQLTAFFKAK
jgi:hypothetical protein